MPCDAMHLVCASFRTSSMPTPCGSTKPSCSNVLPPPESERKLQAFVRRRSAPCWCDELRPRAVTFASRGKLELVLDSVGSDHEIRTVSATLVPEAQDPCPRSTFALTQTSANTC